MTHADLRLDLKGQQVTEFMAAQSQHQSNKQVERKAKVQNLGGLGSTNIGSCARIG